VEWAPTKVKEQHLKDYSQERKVELF